MNELKKMELVRNHISTATALLFPEVKLAIFYTEKAGATSLINWYHYQKGLMNFQVDPSIRDNAGNAELMIAYQSSQTYQRALSSLQDSVYEGNDDWTKIKFVRNPYERGISAFYMVMLLTESSLSLREFFNLPKTYFTKFGDGHCRPQVTLLERLNILKFEKIVKLEEAFERQLAQIERDFGLKRSHNKYNSHANKRAKQEEIAYDGLPADIIFESKDIRNNIKVPSFSAYLSDEALMAAIYEKYEDDFKHYNYPIMHSAEAIQRNKIDYLEQMTPRMDEFLDAAHKEYRLRNNFNWSRYHSLVNQFDENEKLLIYGAGEIMFELLFLNGLIEKNIVGIVDKNSRHIEKWKLFFNKNLGITLTQPDGLLSIQFDKILVTLLKDASDVIVYLQSLGVPAKKIVQLSEN